jgi:hypothetical protein
MEVAELVYKRRDRLFDDTEKELLSNVYHLTLNNKWF